MSASKSACVFLDRVGTIIEERHYLSRPEQVELLPGAAEGLRRLQDAGFALVLITNQSGVGRGYFSLDDLDAVHAHLRALLRGHGVELQHIYYCPHTPDELCECRKPLPGMILQACRELDVLPQSCFMIGDKACDVDAGREAGTRTFLVRTGYGGRESGSEAVQADFVVDNLDEAALRIVALAEGDFAGNAR